MAVKAPVWMSDVILPEFRTPYPLPSMRVSSAVTNRGWQQFISPRRKGEIRWSRSSLSTETQCILSVEEHLYNNCLYVCCL